MSCNSQKIAADVGYLDIELAQGADTDISIEYKVNNTLVDLSGYDATLQVRLNYGSPVLLELNTDLSNIVVSATSPNIILRFGAATTSAMTVYDNMIYDLEIVSGSGVTTKILRGNFSLIREVTV